MSKKYTGLIKALEAIEERFGVSFLEAPTGDRNNREARIFVEAAIMEFMKAMGGERYVIYLSRELPEGRTTFTGTENCEPNDIMNVYEAMQEKILSCYDPQVFAALGAASATMPTERSGKTDARSMHLIAEAMGEALNDLPPDIIKKVDENMNEALRKRGMGGVPKRKPEDTDPLADLM